MAKRSTPTTDHLPPVDNIVPAGFKVTAHPVFRDFKRPRFQRDSPPEAVTFAALPPPSPTVACSDDGPSEAQAWAAACEAALASLDAACPICLGTLVAPVTLAGCLHSFCLRCLERWVPVSESCPLCKAEVRVFVSADPARPETHRLFSRPSETARAVGDSGAVGGLAEAVRVQAALHALLDAKSTARRTRGGADEEEDPAVGAVGAAAMEAEAAVVVELPCAPAPPPPPPPTGLAAIVAALDAEVAAARALAHRLAMAAAVLVAPSGASQEGKPVGDPGRVVPAR
jgi:hypothetical protein